MATVKAGTFDITGATAREWLRLPNPNGRSNAEVVKPWANGMDIARRRSDTWVVDFGVDAPVGTSALFELPFSHVRRVVQPTRSKSNRKSYRERWWLMAEPTPKMRNALLRLSRFIATPVIAKHRLFAWLHASVLPDHALIVTTRADDVTFGVLHSRFHELWSLRLGTSLEDRPRYTPTTTFETFPFPTGLTPADTAHQRTEAVAPSAVGPHPNPLPEGEGAKGSRLPEGDGAQAAWIPAGLPPAVRAHAEAIARAAKHLNDLRERWLNPPEWTRRESEVVPLGMDLSPYPDRILARDGFETQLAQRTLTKLYNERPAWLAQAHEALDAAVAAAYGWPDYSPQMSDEEILRRLLALNRERATH